MADQPSKISQLPAAADQEISNTNVLPISIGSMTKKISVKQLKEQMSGSAFTDGGATNTLTFDSSKWYGTSIAPITNSSILFDITNAVSGSQAIVYHSGSSEPIYPSGTIKRGIGSYINGETNILTFTYLNSNEILLDVDMMNPASFPEVNYWLQRGGVASGFLLNALNQFMATIQPMRSKIVRFNPLWGETFASIFVPLIVNTDGSTTPIGGGVDMNVGWTESNWSFIGSSALTNNNQVKYISIPINPYAVQELGQDDICIGFVVKVNSNGPQTALTNGGNIQCNISNVLSYHSSALNSSSITNVPNSNAGNLLREIYLNRVNLQKFICQQNDIVQVVPAISSPPDSANILLGGTSNSVMQYVGGYLIAKGLTPLEISTIRAAWMNLIKKIGRG